MTVNSKRAKRLSAGQRPSFPFLRLFPQITKRSLRHRRDLRRSRQEIYRLWSSNLTAFSVESCRAFCFETLLNELKASLHAAIEAVIRPPEPLSPARTRVGGASDVRRLRTNILYRKLCETRSFIQYPHGER